SPRPTRSRPRGGPSARNSGSPRAAAPAAWSARARFRAAASRGACRRSGACWALRRHVRSRTGAKPHNSGVGATATDTIILTFDNLGEASELERGTRDERFPLGRHPSVTDALPRLLDELGRLQLRATFFIEGINCELNPDAVRAIAARGHEVGV